MSAQSAPADAELFRTYWDEGLLDLLAGLGVLLAGVGWETGLGPLAVIQAPLWIVLWEPLRRAIVEPRAGYVRFSTARRRRNARGLRGTVALGLGLFGLAVLATSFVDAGFAGLDEGRLVAGLPAAIVAMGALLTGLMTGARRFLLYAALLLVLAALTVALGRGPALPLAVGGAVVLSVGAILLSRFLRASRQFRETR
jgi:hypothetical protein